MNLGLPVSTLESFEAFLQAQDFEQAYNLLIPFEEATLRLHLREALSDSHSPLYRRLTLEAAQFLQDKDPHQAFNLAYELDSEFSTLPDDELGAGRLATLSIMTHCLVSLGVLESARELSIALSQEALRHHQWGLASWAFHQKAQLELSLGDSFQALQDTRTATGLSLRTQENDLVTANAELRATLSFHLGLLTEAMEQAELALRHTSELTSSQSLLSLLASARLQAGQTLSIQLKQLPILRTQLGPEAAETLTRLALPWQQGDLPDYQPDLLLTEHQHHLWQTAQTHYRDGSFHEAIKAFDLLLMALGPSLVTRLSQAFAYLGRAHVLVLLGDAEGAFADTEQAASLGLALENMALYGKASLFLAKIYHDLGHLSHSLEALQQAYHICHRFGSEGYARALAITYALYSKDMTSPFEGDPPIQHHLQHLSLDLSLPTPLRFQAHLSLAVLLHHASQPEVAQHHFHLAQALAVNVPAEVHLRLSAVVAWAEVVLA